ncbi:DUF421 domain-containing protein [Paenibacillus sp. HN-1]|uniref:YetF domain-containing protein n=1 Tax=Paenibacillus TaxID=44249 RepID=UPI001CA87A56|nr:MULTISPECIES: DUF421 domain-containing protein [Paenibacillus]MBY9079629.1 DUF421 domain-containing protein [Paenibacillus sp. CGMCC 1.18879]MBY9084318.1 DUF421 domain-containing protein [Paenibacillus sinensis]
MVGHIATHAFLTLLMYVTIFLCMRIMGKREIGKLSVFDLTISIMIAEIATFVIEDIERPLYDGFVPMATLVLTQVVLAHFSLKSRKLRLLIDGRPSVLISGGQIRPREMRKQRYNIDDLLLQLRGQNITNLADVEFAILEPTGQLTVIEKNKDASGSGDTSTNQASGFGGGHKGSGKSSDGTGQSDKHGMKIENIRYEGLPVPLIMDGRVQDENLEMIGKNRFWLKNQVRQKGTSDFRDIFLCTIDHKGKIYIDRRPNK